MTLLRFSGGEAVEVGLALDEVQKMVQQAISRNMLLEFRSPDGRKIVVNPHQVQYVQNAADVENDAHGLEATNGLAASA